VLAPNRITGWKKVRERITPQFDGGGREYQPLNQKYAPYVHNQPKRNMDRTRKGKKRGAMCLLLNVFKKRQKRGLWRGHGKF